jgi:F-type H+-transporting ATPase subunit a
MKLNMKVNSLFLTGLFTFFGLFARANNSIDLQNQVYEEEVFSANEMIMHHISDAHEWHIMGPNHGKGSVVLYLPVVLWDNGLKVFSSAALYHGEEKALVNSEGKTEHYFVNLEKGYAIYHETIYRVNDLGELSLENGKVSNSKPLDISITKNVLSLFFSAVLILIIMFGVKRAYKGRGVAAPRGIASFIEPLIIFVNDEIAKDSIGGHKYQKYTPYLLTIFFFIWINSLLGLVPILPGGANLIGNISITFTLAVFTLLITVFSGNKNYWRHIFAMPGVPIPILFVMIPVEIIGIFTKPFALMVRLFANMTAGHIIVLALIAIIFVNKSLAWSALSVPMALFITILELLVGVLQAYIFAMLSAVFIGMAVEEEHH